MKDGTLANSYAAPCRSRRQALFHQVARTVVLSAQQVPLLCNIKCAGNVAVGQGLHYAMRMISDFQISLALQVLRERRKFSAQDLALSAGLPPDEVSRIEAGEIGLGYLTAARLTQVLQVSLAEIALAAHALDPELVRRRYQELTAHPRVQ